MWFMGLSFDSALVKNINLQNELNHFGSILMKAQQQAMIRGSDFYNEDMHVSLFQCLVIFHILDVCSLCTTNRAREIFSTL